MNNNEIKILVVEDDIPIKNLMLNTIRSYGYCCEAAVDGETAIQTAKYFKPDIILLDLGLPDVDGIKVLKSLREWSTSPVIVVSARSNDSDKIEALDQGADDYVTKPFSVDELMARIRVAQRRITDISKEESPVFTNAGLVIDYSSSMVSLDGSEILLTPNEFKLLCCLSKNVGKVITHTYITDHIWGNSLESDIATLRVLMASLRKKLGERSGDPKYIQTHPGIGYRMNKI